MHIICQKKDSYDMLNVNNRCEFVVNNRNGTTYCLTATSIVKLSYVLFAWSAFLYVSDKISKKLQLNQV